MQANQRSLVGLTKMRKRRHGVATSLINVGQQVGSSIELAVLGTRGLECGGQQPAIPGRRSSQGRPRCMTTRWRPGSLAATWSRRASWRWR